jgi:trans-aconitate methyltransferase
MYRRPDLYDAIYSYKDYEKEAALVHDLIQKHKRSKYNKLLDIACGTGKHISYLKQNYRCEGLDSSHFLIEAAKKRNPECEFMEGDMRHFELGRWFDAVVCLFSAIGYVKTFEALESTLASFAVHTEPGGVVIVEPWIFPENYRTGNIYFDQVDLPDYKVARMSLSQRVADVSVLSFHFMLGTPKGIETWIDQSELGLFSQADYQVAFERAGFEVEFEPDGFSGRGLFIGRKPL